MATGDTGILLGTTGNNLYDALGQNVRRVIDQVNRTAPLLSILRVEPADGKNVCWDANIGNASGPKVYGEFEDVNFVTDALPDDYVPAILGFSQYGKPIQISSRAKSAAKANANPEALMNVEDRQTANVINEIARGLNGLMYTGAGTANTIAGMWVNQSTGAFACTGSYAGVNRNTYSGWKGSSPTTQPVTGSAISVDLIEQTRTNIFNASGEFPDVLMTSPNTFRVLKNIFNGSAVRRWSPSEVADTVHDELYISGMRVIPDYTISETDTYGKMYFLNTNWISIVTLMPAEGEDFFYLTGNDGKSVPIPVKALPIANLGAYSRLQLLTDLQLKVEKPNSCAYVGNLSLTVS